MARERLSMRRIKQRLPLASPGRSQRELAQAIGTARSTVSDYLKRAEMAAHYGVAILPTRVAKPRDKSWVS